MEESLLASVPKAFIPVDASWLLPGQLSMLSEQPPVYLIRDFLDAPSCLSIIEQTRGAMVPAPVVGAAQGELSEARSSTTCYLRRADMSGICGKISRLLCGKDISHMELPQVGSYESGQEYRAHYDAFNLADKDGLRFAHNGGQRVATVLVYLNTVTEGGETHFPRLHLRVHPEQGSALLFFPASLDGVLDEDALHAALPCGAAPKHVVQVWVRQGAYDGVHNVELAQPL